MVYAQSGEELSALVRRLYLKVEELVGAMEKMNLAEYIHLLNRPGRLLYINFIAGVARGLGIAVGFTLLGAIGLYFLQKLVLLNLPLIGNFIATIVEMVQARIQSPGY
ncbi:MAG: hypothetical protein GX295_04505 [Syntrophomonadaceae bacterium]|nr:hypothetical protein [Syntrophomonadaceae bacterium]